MLRATFCGRHTLSEAAYSSLQLQRGYMNSSHMPPVPPANRSRKGRGSDPEMSKDTSVKQPEHHHNAAEEGETANIKQNTTNKGFFRGRRLG
jgi:hypothetical protein